MTDQEFSELTHCEFCREVFFFCECNPMPARTAWYWDQVDDEYRQVDDDET